MEPSINEMQAFARAYASRLSQLPEETLCSRIAAQFHDCDPSTKTLTYMFQTAPWMSNPGGMLHGGISGEAISLTAGALLHYLYPEGGARLLSAQLSYPRPGLIGRDTYVTVTAIQAGRTMLYLRASAWQSGHESRPFIDGTLIYELESGALQK